ncbi:MAG TPA: carbohydrate kinase [Candidatus Onthomonas avicola]|nr:carbohydrate kinase [Candidatus Onthomonas avicola]
MALITTIGEILIDLTQTGQTSGGVPQFAAYPGGAPANVAVAAARLGADSAFIGKVGPDRFGEQLRRSLRENGVDDTFLLTDPTELTTLAVVTLDAAGERSFSFYRSPGADSLLTQEEAVTGLATRPRILHFGSVALSREPAQSAVLVVAAMARRMGTLITFDPNYRADLWPSEADAIYRIKQAFSLCDIIKISRSELRLLTGTDDLEKGTAQLADYGILMVLVTLGADGVFYRYRNKTGHVPGVPCQVVDTNGAGDAFFGAVLAKLSTMDLSTPIPIRKVEAILAFANQVGSITVSRSGAIPSMPTLDEVEPPVEV